MVTTPVATHLNTNALGADSFAYTVSDGIATDTVNVAITIRALFVMM